MQSIFIMLVTVLALIARAQGEVTAKKIADINSQAPCEAELHDICGVAYPQQYRDIFDARKCLWANRESLTQRCSQYLLYQSRSIIEPCYDAIVLYCNNVPTGENRVHQCLIDKAKSDVSQQCRDVLQEATLLPENKTGTDSLATSLFDVMVFQEVLKNVASGNDAVQAIASFITDLNNQLTQLENLILKLLQMNDNDLEEDDIDSHYLKNVLEGVTYFPDAVEEGDDTYYGSISSGSRDDDIDIGRMSYAELVEARMGAVDEVQQQEQQNNNKYSLRGSAASVTFPLVK